MIGAPPSDNLFGANFFLLNFQFFLPFLYAIGQGFQG